MSDLRAIRAELRLRPTSSGGRITPILSGYRSIARFSGTNLDFGFELQLETEELRPGATGLGRVIFWAGNELPELAAGQTFELREGARVVGEGTVIVPVA